MRPSRFAFDFFNTLDTHEDVRRLARAFHALGHEVHVVSAISPGLPGDNDETYAEALMILGVPFTKIWRVDHDPKLKVEVLTRIGAIAFWDDLKANVDAARAAGFSTCHVGVDPFMVTCHHLDRPSPCRECSETIIDPKTMESPQ